MEKWSFMQLLNTQGSGEDDYREIYLSPYDVVPSESNFYSQENIEELADSMLAVGQQQPTVVARVNGVYKIISGHRRNLANIYNIECGALPVDYQARYLYKDMGPAMFELSLLMGNVFNRVLTPYEEAEQAARLKAALSRAKEEDGLEIRGKLRDLVADMMHTSAAEIGRMNKINNSLVPEAKEQFKAGKLGKSAAYETSRLPENEQKEIAEAVARGENIGHKNIAERMKEKLKEKAIEKAIKCEEKLDKMESQLAVEKEGVDGSEFMEAVEAQPKLPLLTNSDHRAAFVDAYETWPMWIETEQTGERYYRYDLEDGTSMVVKVYHAMLFEGFAEGSYKSQYREGYGRHEYYLLQPGTFFRDCEANRSALIDKLKEIQKAKKGKGNGNKADG